MRMGERIADLTWKQACHLGAQRLINTCTVMISVADFSVIRKVEEAVADGASLEAFLPADCLAPPAKRRGAELQERMPAGPAEVRMCFLVAWQQHACVLT